MSISNLILLQKVEWFLLNPATKAFQKSFHLPPQKMLSTKKYSEIEKMELSTYSYKYAYF